MRKKNCKTERIVEPTGKASLTIEASLGLTVFMFTVILLIMPMKMLNTQRRVQMVLETTAKELSQYAYVRYRMSEGEEGISGGEEASPEFLSLFSGAAIGVYLSGKVKDAAGEGRIEKLNFNGTEITQDGEEITLRAEYRLKLPFSIFRLDSVPAVSKSVRRGWIGSEGGRGALNREGQEDREEIVYVGNSMGRYHRSKSCHYLSNNITGISYGDIGGTLSSDGRHYKPCSVCGKGASSGQTVYIMPSGEYYHSRKDCSSIAYYVREVPLSEVEYLGECSYCGRGK